jgi:hypothetical protein
VKMPSWPSARSRFAIRLRLRLVESQERVGHDLHEAVIRCPGNRPRVSLRSPGIPILGRAASMALSFIASGEGLQTPVPATSGASLDGGTVVMGVRSPLLKSYGDDFAWSLLVRTLGE